MISMNLHTRDIRYILFLRLFCKTEMIFKSIMRDKIQLKIDLANHQEDKKIRSLDSSKKIVTRCIKQNLEDEQEKVNQSIIILESFSIVFFLRKSEACEK